MRQTLGQSNKGIIPRSLTQPRDWERYPNQFWHLLEAFLSLSIDMEKLCLEPQTVRVDTETKLPVEKIRNRNYKP